MVRKAQPQSCNQSGVHSYPGMVFLQVGSLTHACVDLVRSHQGPQKIGDVLTGDRPETLSRPLPPRGPG